MNAPQSTELNELFTALAKAQAEMETAGKTNSNPFFKSRYADLAEVVNSSRAVLTKHGISVSQIIDFDEVSQILISILAHSSGQFIQSRARIQPPKNDVQTFGSYITYLRRYSYAALVGVVVQDEDDDGEKATQPHREEGKKTEPKIGTAEASQLIALCNGNEKLIKELLKAGGVNDLMEISASRFDGAIKWIQQKQE